MGKFITGLLVITFFYCNTARAQPEEKLFVHVDKSFYCSGETIWFKIYSIDATTNVPNTNSGIAYVEVLDKDQKAIFQEKIALYNGKGDGNYRISPSLPSGHYIFRAYTNWMKNFGPDAFFQQQLTIVNTLMESGGPDTVKRSEDNIHFFPEGGNLVNGIPSVIAFKAVNAAGQGISCRGVVLDQHQDTVTRFQSNRLGMGSFSLTPAKGNTYYARVLTATSTLSEKLPAAFDQGYVMHLSAGNNISITVTTPSTASTPTVYLSTNTHNHSPTIREAYLVNNQATFTINSDSLGDGVTHFTVLNNNRQPVCQRLWFKPATKKLQITANLNPLATTSQNLAAANLNATAATRQKLTVALSTTDPAGRPTAANLSMSVFLLDSLQSIPEENILTYCWLSSDLRGNIESPSHYFDPANPSTETDLDNLMLTQGWSRYRWEDIVKDKPGYFDFQPETNGLLISGKITDKRIDRVAPPTVAYLSVPGKPFIFAATHSRTDGTLIFHAGNFYGNREIIMQANNLADSNLHIEITNPFSDRFSWQPTSDFLIPKGSQHQLLDRSIAVQAENAYLTAEKLRLSPLAVSDTTDFYGRPDLRYNLDDYTRFITMDEVIREFVQDVRVRRNGSNAYFRVRNALFNTFFDDDPLLLIDGVPVFDGDKMIAVDPLKIEKIDVISHRYHFGPSLTDGIISFLSYDGDLGGYQLDPTAVAVQYNGIQQHQEFYTPVYTPGAQSPLPDLRNQLLWSPEIDIDATGTKQLTLYTSDWQGKFAVVVQGITPDGQVGYSVKTFVVDHQ